jgi:hypothetical protein
LLEPQRTNLFLWSESFNDSSINTGVSLVANQYTSPDGYVNADKLVGATGTDRNILTIARTFGGLSSSTAYTTSIYVYKDTATQCTLYIRDGSTGIIVSTSVTLVAGWQRIERSFTTGASTTAVNWYLGNTNGDIGIWGAQFEAGAYATSYIPTLSTSVTRVADAASKTGISSLIGQTEGTVMVEYNQSLIGQSATRRIFALSDGTTNNRITAYINSANGIDFYVRNSGGDLFLGTAASPIGNTKGVHKIGAAYKNGDYAVYLDGALIISGAGTAGTIPACSRFDLGNQLGANDLYEPMMQALLFKTRLTNAQLAELTTI